MHPLRNDKLGKKIHAAIQYQSDFMHDRQFIAIKEVQALKWETRVPSCMYLFGDRPDGNEMPVSTILVTALNLFTKNGKPIQTPFTKFHSKPDGNGFFLQLKVTEDLITKQYTSYLKPCSPTGSSNQKSKTRRSHFQHPV